MEAGLIGEMSEGQGVYLDCLGHALSWGLMPREGTEPVALGKKLTPSEREAPGYEGGPVCDSQA